MKPLRLGTLGIAALACTFLLAAPADALSVQWSSGGTIPSKLYTRWGSNALGTFNNTTATVLYGATVSLLDENGAIISTLASGATVPAGSKVAFTFKPHVFDDVSWFSSGGVSDSPYGYWSPGAATAADPIQLCTKPYFITNTGNGRPFYLHLSVAPPAKHIEGLPACTQYGANPYDMQCTLTQPGAINPTFVFEETYGQFHPFERYNGCSTRPLLSTVKTHGGAVYQMPVTRQSIPFSLTVEGTVTGEPPASPSVATAGSCLVGTPHSITLQATDPDTDAIRYGVDWDGNGSIDQWIPPSGYVPSGTAQTASRTHSTPGTKTVKVIAQDEGGLLSNWSSASFDCAGSAIADINEGENDVSGDGGNGSGNVQPAADLTLRVVPSLVKSGKTTKVNWSATGVDSCTVTAPNGDSWNGLLSGVGGEVSRPITGEVVYTLACIDRQGATHTKQATVRIIPTFEEK